MEIMAEERIILQIIEGDLPDGTTGLRGYAGPRAARLFLEMLEDAGITVIWKSPACWKHRESFDPFEETD